MSDDYDAVMMVIGGKDHLTADFAHEAATAFVLAHMNYPSAQLMISIDGFGDDRRELWDIPPAMEYLQLFCELVSDRLGRDITTWHLDQTSSTLAAVAVGILEKIGVDPDGNTNWRVKGG